MRSYFVNQLALNGLARDCQKHRGLLYHSEEEVLEYAKWYILHACAEMLQEHEPISQYLLTIGIATARRTLHEYVFEQKFGDYTTYAWPYIEARIQNFLNRFYRCNGKQQYELIRLADSYQRWREIKLTPQEEIVLVSCYHFGLTAEEAGQRLNQPADTIHDILSVIREKMNLTLPRS